MRVCLISPNTGLAALNRKLLLKKVKRNIGEQRVDDISLVSYSWPREGMDTSILFDLPNRKHFKMRACSAVLQLIDKKEWLPASLAGVPLRIFKEELIETVRGCDPDVIITFDIRWHEQLKTLLRKNRFKWLCLSEYDRRTSLPGAMRTYNPFVKVSIVLPTYNGSRYLRKSIESCLRQSHENLELIVVDDASQEDLSSMLSGVKDPRIRFFRHSANQGIAAALNTGFRQSTGEYLTWTSDDNYYAENALQEMLTFMHTYQGVDFVYADHYTIDEHDKVRGVKRVKSPRTLCHDNYIGACFLYKRTVYEKIGDYNPDTFLAEDYDYWVRVSKRFTMQPLFKPLYYYRIHDNSLTAKYGRAQVLEKVAMVKKLNLLENS